MDPVAVVMLVALAIYAGAAVAYGVLAEPIQRAWRWRHMTPAERVNELLVRMPAAIETISAVMRQVGISANEAQVAFSALGEALRASHSHVYPWSEVLAAKAEARQPVCRLCGDTRA